MSSDGLISGDWAEFGSPFGQFYCHPNTTLLSFSPRVAYTYSKVEIDAYTETGGGFPAIFNSREQERHEVRFGVDVGKQIAESPS